MGALMTKRTIVPMNCIDKVLLSYEVGQQRMTFHLILSIEGHLEPDRLNRALLSVVRLHPTMRTRLCSSLSRHFREVQEECGEKILEFSDSTVLPTAEDLNGAQTEYGKLISEWINRPIELSRELPVRALLLRRDGAGYSLIFTFHHSAIDGLRAIRFIEEVLARYEHRDAFESALSAGLPKQRNGDELIELARAERRRVPSFRRAMLCYMFRFLALTPFRRSTRILNKGEPSPEIDFCSGRLDSARFQQMKSRSKALGTTANDILMAAAFRAIEAWNRLHGKDSGKISLMVPVNVAHQEQQNVAANLVSFISVATNRKDRRDPTQLLRKVNTESASALKRNRGSAYAYIYFAYVLSRLPLAAMRVFAKWIKFPIYADTVLHSNLGVVRLGGDDGRKGYRIMDFTAVAPVVDVMGMFFCISTYNGTLGVDLSYNKGCFSKEEAQTFLDLYLDGLEDYRLEPQGQERLVEVTVAGAA
jgi:NRPS condensation-like uncharacterized protein